MCFVRLMPLEPIKPGLLGAQEEIFLDEVYELPLDGESSSTDELDNTWDEDFDEMDETWDQETDEFEAYTHYINGIWPDDPWGEDMDDICESDVDEPWAEVNDPYEDNEQEAWAEGENWALPPNNVSSTWADDMDGTWVDGVNIVEDAEDEDWTLQQNNADEEWTDDVDETWTDGDDWTFQPNVDDTCVSNARSDEKYVDQACPEESSPGKS